MPPYESVGLNTPNTPNTVYDFEQHQEQPSGVGGRRRRMGASPLLRLEDDFTWDVPTRSRRRRALDTDTVSDPAWDVPSRSTRRQALDVADDHYADSTATVADDELAEAVARFEREMPAAEAARPHAARGQATQAEPARPHAARGQATQAEPDWRVDDRYAAPPPGLEDASGRRTIVITGHVGDRYLAVPSPYSRVLRSHERSGSRPDRVAMWAVLLGIALLLAAATSSHAAMIAVHAAAR